MNRNMVVSPNQIDSISFRHEALFWTHVNKTDTCWLWTGYISPKGYGRFVVTRDGGRISYQAHNVAWFLKRGDFPEGLEPDHLCLIKHCVNPDHIEWVTSKVNLMRSAYSELRPSTQSRRE